MDDYRQHAAHIANELIAGILKALTPAEKATHQRRARAMLAFYCSLLLCGGIAILANHSSSNTNSVMAQVSTPRKAP
jgi:hypothetical protein